MAQPTVILDYRCFDAVVRTLFCAACSFNIITATSPVLAHFATPADAGAGVVSERAVAIRECTGCAAGFYAASRACAVCPANSTSTLKGPTDLLVNLRFADLAHT